MGRIFGVYSSKGGVGKSYVAVNLAASIRAETHQSVLLLDFTLPFSIDIGGYLALPEVRSLAKLIPMGDTVDAKLLHNYPVLWRQQINVLSLVRDENDLNIFDSDLSTTLEPFLLKLCSQFDFIIIDLGLNYGTLAENILNICDRIILPFVGEPLSMLCMVRDFDLLQQRNFSRAILHPVFNKYVSGSLISPGFAEKRLNRPLTGIIPYNKNYETDFSAGRILPIDSPGHAISQAFSRLALQLLQAVSGQAIESALSGTGNQKSNDELGESEKAGLKIRIHAELLAVLDLKSLDVVLDDDPIKFQELQTTVRRKTIEILDKQTTIKSRTFRDKVVREILQEALGLGPLEDLLEDPAVSEIMVVKWDQIYVEKAGKLELVPQKFLSEQQLMGILERVVAPLGRRIDIASPMVDARLKDGSRVNAVIPPLAVSGANITIRKFGKDTVGVEELIAYGSINRQLAEFLQAAVKCRLNVIVSGGTGSGKTTLLNILSSFIPENERIVTIEDSAELQLRQPHVITLESRPKNIEGTGEVSIRELVKNSLRMRPDRIVVGECRAGEALDMLQAMNTGHDGSLTTLHANSTREALSRLETLVLFAGFELPVKAIREQIVGAVDILIQLSRLKDGSRKVIQVSEVTGLDKEFITMGDIYLFEQDSIDNDGKIVGDFVATGYTPRCLSVFEEQGVNIPKETFWKTT